MTISQAGAACSYGASPGSQSFAAAGGTATVAVSAGAGCAWTTSEDAAWLTIVSAASGSGDGTYRSHCRAEHVGHVSRCQSDGRGVVYQRHTGLYGLLLHGVARESELYGRWWHGQGDR